MFYRKKDPDTSISTLENLENPLIFFYQNRLTFFFSIKLVVVCNILLYTLRVICDINVCGCVHI